MRVRLTVLAVVYLSFASIGVIRAHGDQAAEAVCDRLLPAPARVAALGSEYTLKRFDDPTRDEWFCHWETGGEPPQRMMIRYLHGDMARVGVQYEETIAKLKKNFVIESVPNLGQAAVIVPVGPSFLVYVRRAEALVSITTMGPTRTQALAVAHRVDAVSPQAVDAARTALAAIRAQEPSPVAPAQLTEDVVVRRNGRPLECEQLLPRSELVAVLDESYRLAHVMDLRPGFSMCEWKRTAIDDPVSLAVSADREFADNQMSGPSDAFNFEASQPICAGRAEPVPGIGLQAVRCAPTGGPYQVVVVRRARDLLVLSCPNCGREQAIGLARAAAR